MTRFYGCVKDCKDERDRKFALPAPSPDFVLPDAHDLTAAFPPAMDQGQYGTCTVHGTTAAYRYNLINPDRLDVELSRAQLYWDAGVIEGNTADVGRQIRDVVKSAATKGIAREELWSYDRVCQIPPPEIYIDAANQVLLEYQRVDVDRTAINTAIYVGHPIIIGIPVFKDFESDEVASTGDVPMPSFGQSEVGWHCMLLGGYDPQWDNVLNSWGDRWGENGYCRLPRGYIEKYAQDCWTIFTDK